MSNDRTIIGLVAGSTALSLFSDAAKSGGVPDVRIAVGGVLVGMALLVLNDFAPQIGFGLAVVIAITATLTAGPEVISRINPLS